MEYGKVTREHLRRLLETTSWLLESYAKIYNAHNHTPAPDSLVERELAEHADNGMANEALQIGLFLMESVGDHLMAFRDSLEEPCKTIAPATCIRAEIEAAAISLWLLDVKCEARERIARGLAYRYDGLIEQKRAAADVKDQEAVKRAEARMDYLADLATQHRFHIVLDKRNKRIGVGCPMPAIIDRIEAGLNRRWEYRILSALAHGHLWAIQQVAYERTSLEHPTWPKSAGLTKALKPEFAMYLGNIGFDAFARVAWNTWQVFDWDRDELTEILDVAYDRIELNAKVRFWKA